LNHTLVEASTKDLLLELQRRSVASAMVVMTIDEHNSDAWAFAIKASPILTEALIRVFTAKINEHMDHLQRRDPSGGNAPI